MIAMPGGSKIAIRRSTLFYGLKGYYKLDDVQDSSALDSFGTNQLAVLDVSQGYSGKIETSYLFNNTNYQKAYSSNMHEYENISISCWIKCNNVSAYGGVVTNFNTHVEDLNVYGYDLCITDTGLLVWIVREGNYEDGTCNTWTTNEMDDDNWHLIVCTFDGNYAKIYVDGNLNNTSNLWKHKIIYCVEDQFVIGNRTGADDIQFGGYIDEVGIWNRALTSTEVAELYNGGNGNAYPFAIADSLLKNIVSYWKLDETSGLPQDSIGGHHIVTNNGVILNSTGKIGKAGLFEHANNDYLIATSDSDLEFYNKNFSFSAWIYPNVIPTSGSIHGIIGGDGYSAHLNVISYEGDYLKLRVEGETFGGTCDISINSGTWYHVVATYNHDTSINNIVYYVNGSSEIESKDISVNSGAASKWIGARNDGWDSVYTFDGLIDEVGIWNKALTPNEISRLYNNGIGNTYPFTSVSAPSILLDGSTMGWYLYDQPSTITLTDSSVSKWMDVLGSGRNLEASTNASTWPKIDASGISFLDVDNELQDLFSYTTPCFVYAVIRQNSWTDGNTIFNSPAGPRLKQTTPTPSVWAYQGVWGLNNNEFTLGEWKILRWQLNGANSKIICNNGDPAINNATGGSLNSFYIGSATVAANVSYKEIILRKGDTPAQETAIYNYLATKYNIVSPPPSVLFDGSTFGWYKTDNLSTITKDASNYVSQWSDLSGAGNHLTESTQTYQPIYTVEGLSFDGNDILSNESISLGITIYAYMVMKMPTMVEYTYPAQFDGNVYLQVAGNPDSLKMRGGSAFSEELANGKNSWAIYRVLFNGANSKYTYNANSSVDVSIDSVSMNEIAIGGGYSGYGAQIDVKELILRGKADSLADETAIYNYLANKYNIT